MNVEEYQIVSRWILAHEYHQQETYQIDGTRYVLEQGNTASTERLKLAGIPRHAGRSEEQGEVTSTEQWILWIYGESRFADYVAGNTIEEVFEKAAGQGVPVEKLTIDQWHD